MSFDFLTRRKCLAALAALSAAASTAADAQEAAAVLDLWQRMRAQWLLNPRLAYFDTATLAPMLRAVLAGQYRALEALHTDPQRFYAARFAPNTVRDVLLRLCGLMGCGVDELAAVQSAEAGVVFAADMVSLGNGDAVVISSQLPERLLQYWQRRARGQGFELNIVHLPMPIGSHEQVLDAFKQALSERTRVMCLSHVQSLDGAIMPIKELCALARERHAMTLVEGSLALGALSVSVTDLDCDVYAGSLCHWLQGAAPSGVVYVRGQWQDQWPGMTPTAILPEAIDCSQWPRLQQRWSEQFITFAPQFQALPIALQWHASLGAGVIENRLRQLQTYARINLQSRSGIQMLTCNQPGMQLHILSLRAEDRSALQLADWLARNDNVLVGVVSNSQETRSVVRVAFHVGNSLDDIDRLVQGLTRALRY
jgi:isopenicillin-N epimerase